jgi:hypothetical protein
MAGAVSVIDEDDEENFLKLLDQPVAAIPDVEVAKNRILALNDDQSRKKDYQARLERKLRQLDEALANQRDEVESLQRTLHLELEKDKLDQESRKVEQEQKTAKQEERIRNSLADVLYRKAPPAKKKDQVFELDTVLISFVQPNNNIRYNLPFRVDGSTRLKDLLHDVCKYWDVSTDEFILKTMGNSKCQNEILVKECFKQGEIAQLRLEQKNKEQTSVTEAEYKAITPKNKRSRRSSKDKVDLGAEGVLKFGDKYQSMVKKMGGIYFLLKMRDAKPSEHASKIKLRDCIVYLLLAVLTFILYDQQRMAGANYWFIMGVKDALFVEVPKQNVDPQMTTSKNVPAFPELKEYDDIWDFLQITIPYVFWRQNVVLDGTNATGNASKTDQSLDSYNVLPGYLNIRQKSLKPPDPVWENCDKFKDIMQDLSGASCPPIFIDDDNELSNDETFEGLKRYWDWHTLNDAAIDFIRGPAKPWQFVDAEKNKDNHNIGIMHGRIQSYSRGGYSVEYKSELPTKNPDENLEIYNKDMRELRHKEWIHKTTTRAVLVDFNVYNHQYDMWLAVNLVMELPPSGRVLTSYEIRPYLPSLFETTHEYIIVYFLFVRLLIGGYIGIVVGLAEQIHKTRNQRPGYMYYTSLNGICDVCITICIIASIVVRFVQFNEGSTAQLLIDLKDEGKNKGTQCYTDLSRDYEWLFIMEGLIFTFTMFRLMSLFRINSTIYLFWQTLGKVFMQGIYLSFMFVPAVVFFSVTAHRIWGTRSENFQTMAYSFMSVYHMTKGALDTSDIIELDTLLATIYYMMLYMFVTFLLLTTFAVIFVEGYYVVLLTSSARGEVFGWDKLKTWMIHPVFLSLFALASSGSGSTNDKAE